MRTADELEAVAVEAYGPYAAVTVMEVRALARGVRVLRHRLTVLAGRSECGRTVRYAQRTLGRDSLGMDGGGARDALGRPMRPLAWIEQSLSGAGGERAAVTAIELRALVGEWRRLISALATVSIQSACARSRDYAVAALARESEILSCSRKADSPSMRDPVRA